MNRLLFISSGYRGGGAEAVARDCMNYVVQHGGDGRMFVPRCKAEDPPAVIGIRRPWERYFGGATRLFGVTPDWLHYGSCQALSSVSASNTDVVHVHNTLGGWISLRALRDLCNKVPVVWSAHDLFLHNMAIPFDFNETIGPQRTKNLYGNYWYLDSQSARSKRLRNQNLAIFPRPRIILCHSRFTYSRISTAPQWRDIPVKYVGLPVHLQLSNWAERTQEEARQELGIPLSEKVVLIASSSFDNPHKGLETLKLALPMLSDLAIRLIVIGNLDKTVAARLPCRVTSLGYLSDIDQMARAYRASDVFVLPSVFESFGLVAAEALSMSTPVVCSDIPGPSEITGEDERGLRFVALDPSSLAGSIRRMLENPILARHLADNGRRWVRENHHPDRIMEQMVDVYRDANTSCISL